METSDKKKMMPSEEKVWQKYYPPSAKELLEKKMPEQTLWQYVSEAIWEQGDKYDAFVYFGRHIKRSTFLAEVEKWARVLRGMGLGVDMAASPEALKKYYARAKVAFVFDGMADLLNDILAKPQFKCVVLINATRSMSVPLKITVGLVNWVKTCKVRHSRSKYLTMSQALRRFGGYAGPIEAPYEKERMAMVFSSGGTTKTGEAKLVCMTDKASIRLHWLLRLGACAIGVWHDGLSGTTSEPEAVQQLCQEDTPQRGADGWADVDRILPRCGTAH